MSFTVLAIDHVQLAMPKGEELRTRSFYCNVLGMAELEKPAALKARGGAWFAAGKVQIHLGVEDDFRAAKKAHPAVTVSGGSDLRKRLVEAGYAVRDDGLIPGTKRFYTDDCFGNRIEFVELD